MCEIFPEVESCCFVASVRVGMIFIAILSITTGAVSLGIVEQKTGVGFDKVVDMYNNVSRIHEPEDALSHLSNMISATVTFVSVLFMLAGLILLVANYTDQEGLVQIFVWAVFLNIVISSFLVLAIGMECILEPVCLLGKMDWLTAAACLVMMVFYLVLWFYFICVANSYVLNGYS